MFLPEDLLFKSGQLARVWLAANQHKKLTKAQVLQDKIDEDIQVIIRPEGAAGGPLALRLNGQLLLGVVRIYHRKAHYLHDDCNDALWKIKMAFRPGNIDLPAQTHVASSTSLTLPDMITDLDLLAPMPDPSLLLSQPLDGDLTFGYTTLPDWDASQFLSNSVEQPRHEEMELQDIDDLEIDLGEDLGPEVEIGRDAPSELPRDHDFDTELKLGDDDLGLEIDLGEGISDLPAAGGTELNIGGDTIMGGMDTDLPLPLPEDDVPQLTREESPLSELDADEENRLAQEVTERGPIMVEPEQEEDLIHQARAKRRKVITQDAETMISTAQLRDQQANREKILKQASFLPRDPLLMALLNMQRSGGFVSSILGDGRSQGWAPELRGILSLEVVSRPSKRKRDGAAAGLEQAEEEEGVIPQLDIEQEEPTLGGDAFDVGGTTIADDGSIIQLPSDIGARPEEEEEEAFSPVPDTFDDTTAPLYHPAESGPISLGTKHAVHLLREQFGPEAEESESIRQRNTIVFQELLPEAQTSRADATKMFFEVLVLATKDAIKVEQPGTELGGPLRIRAKRGLWGQWAETAASGELASQSQAVAQQTAVDAPAEGILAGPAQVSVSA
ncbi:sister chromatid cohesion protein 1 [Didymella heteroderae]|uniref:Sister chromatid cohesion protein 1 n=1 Tax=Didymella heteroderae TaxID=1769908 RepID=A0A9P5C3M6_9PLEO|nr:sister chromatid cohesion protein 1 [Didymella heteroderae]